MDKAIASGCGLLPSRRCRVRLARKVALAMRSPKPLAPTLIFWGVLVAFCFNLLDETLMNGGFVAGMQRHFWPGYSATKFFAVNTLFVVLIAAANIVYDGWGRAGPALFFAWERALNGLWHIGWTVAFREYSPGLVTSIPFWVLLYLLWRFAVRPGDIEPRSFWRAGAAALVFETVFLGSIFLVPSMAGR